VTEGQRAADLIVTGWIATLVGPSGFGWAEALAVRDGRVLAVGRRADMEPLAGSRTVQWRLGEQLVVTPSLTDAHLHLTGAALAAGQPDLTSLHLAQVTEAIALAHGRLLELGDDDGWLLGHGWSFEALAGRPTAALLDEAAPGRPVALWAHDHHSRWLSSRALALGGISAQNDPPSGRIERDEHGQPTGILYEQAAGLVEAFIPEAADDEAEAAINAYAGLLASLGVTSVHDPGGVAPDPQLRGGSVRYRAMASAGRLPLRVMACVREEQLERAIELGFRTGQPEGEPEGELASGRYRDGWLKLFSDGALGSRTAALLAPYEPGDPAGPPPGGSKGMPLRSGAQLGDLARHAALAGIASQIHAIGDGAVRTVLDVLETLPAVAGAMHRIEHAQLIDASDVARFAALGVAASVQPCHLLSDAPAMREAWGLRTATAFPLAALDRAGTLLPFGTDAPVEPADPWRGIAAAVTRRGPGWPAGSTFHPEQAISLARALRGTCLDGPRTAHIDDEGHLGIGARADFVVLPGQAFMAIDGVPSAEALAALRPLATVLDGALAWQAASFDP
jgi:predicted amidohydrolase YtcJ